MNTISSHLIETPVLHWNDYDEVHRANWLNLSQQPTPKDIIVTDDQLSADQAYRLMCEGQGILWQGDFQNAKLLLQAVARRVDKKIKPAPDSLLERFHYQRQQQVHRIRILSKIFIPLNSDYECTLKRAPDTRSACLMLVNQSIIKQDTNSSNLIALRDLLGLIGAYEWHVKGLYIKELGSSITPFYGVFTPTRNEYLSLLENLDDLANVEQAYDIGTGTGVLSLMLAQLGVTSITATDANPQAVACARYNINQLALNELITVQEQDLFPLGVPVADLIICNPPWLPAKPHTQLDMGVYDYQHQMLKRLLLEAPKHLSSKGTLAIIMSNLAELLGLREPHYLTELIEQAGFQVVAQYHTYAQHSKLQKNHDLLIDARRREVISMWCLQPK